MTDVKLYDGTASQAMIVLGTYPNGMGIYFRYENDAATQVREISRQRLRKGDRYTAVCRHIYGVGDSCPNCDHADSTLVSKACTYGKHVSVHRGGPTGFPTDDIGILYQESDCTWVAVTFGGTVLGRGMTEASAMRALKLDAKMLAWDEALRVTETYGRVADTEELPPVSGTPGFVPQLAHIESGELYRVAVTGHQGVYLEREDGIGGVARSSWEHHELAEHFTATCDDGYPLGKGCPLHHGEYTPFKIMTLAEYLTQVGTAMRAAEFVLLGAE